MTKYLGKNHEDFVPWLVNQTEIAERLEAAGFDAKTLGRLAIGKLTDRKRPYLDQIISGGVDIDKMDYIVRDSFHTGAGYGSIDIHRLLYTMDIIDSNLSVDGTAVATLESFLLARFESFRTIYFHRASRAVQIMIVRALEAARDELHLLDFDRPEDYLKLDDYKVWTELKECKKSKKIMNDLEARRLLKCAYERTLFSSEAPVSNVFSSEHVRADIEKQIARKARIAEEDVIIDVPTLPSVPYQQTADMQPMDVPVFKRVPQGKKEIVPLAEVSRIVGVLQMFMRLVRVYTQESYRSRVELAAHQILGDVQSSGKKLR
jgi:HD superfamily phosphohydrolase